MPPAAGDRLAPTLEETWMTDSPVAADAAPRRKRASKAKAAASKPKPVSRAAKPASRVEAASAATAPPPPPPQPSPKAQPGASVSASASLDLLPAAQREALEKLSLNLARAAMTAQGAIAEAALRQADRPAALTPDPFHVAPAFGEVMARLAAQPDRLMRAQADLFDRYMDLWKAAAQRVQRRGRRRRWSSRPSGDKRFADPDWTENPVFDVIKQSYLITSDWLNELVVGRRGRRAMTKRRVEFFTKMLTDAISPSNFLLSNPAALREAMQTHGESIVKGMENFAADLARGGGQLSISQTDFTQFKVGENVATAPGKVVFQNELIQLLQFTPTTESVCEIPLLIFPPWINKFYILDLRPENSMIRWLTSQGITVFVASWVNPDARLAEQTFEDYMQGGHLRGHRRSEAADRRRHA